MPMFTELAETQPTGIIRPFFDPTRDGRRPSGLSICPKNVTSAGHFSDRREFAITQLATKLDPLKPDLVLCHSKSQGYGCHLSFPPYSGP